MCAESTSPETLLSVFSGSQCQHANTVDCLLTPSLCGALLSSLVTLEGKCIYKMHIQYIHKVMHIHHSALNNPR